MDFIALVKQLQLDMLEYPKVLLMLLLLPLCAFVIFHRATVAFRNIQLPSIGHPELHSQNIGRRRLAMTRLHLGFLVHSKRFWFGVLAITLGCASFVCLTVAIAHPYKNATDQLRTEGIDIYFTFDMSASMKAYDAKIDEVEANDQLNVKMPNRFEEAKATILDFIERRAERCAQRDSSIPRCDRIGVIMFAEWAFIDVPITTRYDFLLEHIRKRRIDDISASQSAIADGIMSAVASLRHSPAFSRNIILVSDGDLNGGRISLYEAVQAAQQYQIRIFPIVVGKSDTAVIEGKDAWGQKTYYESTFPVNFELLDRVAKQTHGHAYRATSDVEFQEKLDEILDELDVYISENRNTETLIDLTQHYIVLSFLCLVLSLLIHSTLMKKYP